MRLIAMDCANITFFLNSKVSLNRMCASPRADRANGPSLAASCDYWHCGADQSFISYFEGREQEEEGAQASHSLIVLIADSTEKVGIRWDGPVYCLEVRLLDFWTL